MSELAADGARAIPADIQNQLLEPFITATRTALGEMANAEVVVRELSHGSCDLAMGCISTLMRLEFATPGCLLLIFPKPTAANLAKRMLADVPTELDEQLICDCVGEIGNVVAGQAKTLLAGTPYCFTFSLPQILVDDDEYQPPKELRCLNVIFAGEMGEFCLRLCGEISR
jgi:chemotaxis protein CheX